VDAAMPAPTEITVTQLSRLVGLPDAPAIVDDLTADEYQFDPRLLPAAQFQDSMVEEFGLTAAPLSRPAVIVRGADTGKLERTEQPGGLLAACLGYSRMYRDDLAEAALGLIDALYRWSREATDERHG
jgi:hypothetical protein